MILPVGASNFEEAMQMGSETYHHLKVILLVLRIQSYTMLFSYYCTNSVFLE